jgi:hypothetical protein
MNLQSPKTQVPKSNETVFEFLSTPGNYEKLMPENTERFEVLGEESFLFQLKGMPEIQLEIQEKSPFEKIKLGSLGGKLPFTLVIEIASVSENESGAQFLFEGQFNAMMGMMVKKPIQKFIDTLSENLEEI